MAGVTIKVVEKKGRTDDDILPHHDKDLKEELTELTELEQESVQKPAQGKDLKPAPTPAATPAAPLATPGEGVTIKPVATVQQEKATTSPPKPVEKALRDGFGEGLVLAGKENANVVALSADLTESNRMEEFKKTFPDRFVEIGIAEQNLVSVAAGMTHAGKVAFCASFAVFSPGRSWDQVRVSCCYSNANVKIYGGHAGITVGEDGATHQALEDIAITRAIPRMTVIVPADATEMRKATLEAARTPGTIYLRGGRVKLPQVTSEESPFAIGKANVLRYGEDVTIIACGIMVREAMLAADELAKGGIKASVVNMHTIKPIDETAIISAAHETGAIVTAEEHQIIGGLGSAVCEVLADHYPVPVERVGVKDTFCESGNADALLDKYGLRAKDIVAAARRAHDRKKGKREVLKVSPASIKKIVAKLPKTVKPAKAAKAPVKKPARKT